ncbi:hypothetical protein QT974_02395 [Microcoleus sp. herbarium12]
MCFWIEAVRSAREKRMVVLQLGWTGIFEERFVLGLQVFVDLDLAVSAVVE